MRFRIRIAAAIVLGAWIITSLAPAGMNICVQNSGRTSVGYGCTCDQCMQDSISTNTDCSQGCCNDLQNMESLKGKCCTCTRIVLVSSLIQIKPDMQWTAEGGEYRELRLQEYSPLSVRQRYSLPAEVPLLLLRKSVVLQI